MKRFLSLCLLLALLLGATAAFSACKTPAGPAGGGGGAGEVEYLDRLDEYGDSMDFCAQEEFVICYPEQYYYEVYGKENSSEKLDTMIYNRNRLMEGRFGVKIATDGGVLDSGGHGHFDYVQLALNSGDVPFDMTAITVFQGGNLVLGNGGNFLDWRKDVPYARDSIEAGAEWWPRALNLTSTVMGRQYVAVSDFNITTMEMCMAVIFNRDLARSTNVAPGIDPEKYTTDSTLYDVVCGNDWTVDVMTNIVKDYWRDNPSVGRRGERDDNDRFGLLAPAWTDADAFSYAFGYEYVKNNGIDPPELWDWDGTQYDAVVALRELYYSDGAWTDTTYQHLGTRAAFFAQEDRVLFMLNTLGSLKYEAIHTMEQDFGVLPYPKWTRDQARYQTGSNDGYTVLAIPYTALWDDARLRMSGALIEALSAENCKSVKGPYYDEIITHHNVTDGDSAEMIHMMMENRVYTLGIYHYDALEMEGGDEKNGSFAHFFRFLLRNPQTDIVQYWQSNAQPLQLKLDDLLNQYAALP